MEEAQNLALKKRKSFGKGTYIILKIETKPICIGTY